MRKFKICEGDLIVQYEMFAYYGSKGCDVKKLGDYTDGENTI